MSKKMESQTIKDVAISQFNFVDEVRIGMNLPSKVIMYDVTLRDGEQTPGIVFRKNDKIKIAQALDALGVDRIEAGMPGVSKEDKEAIKAIANLGLTADIWGFSRMIKSDVDLNIDCGVKSIICEISTSPLKMKAYRFTEEKVLNLITDTIDYAKSHGLYVAFFAVDATRSDLIFLEKTFKIAVKEGHADEVVMVDTLGVSTPRAIHYLTKKLKEWVDVPVHIHCHNDFGLATACTLAGIEAGANCVHSTINGLGEKTGNADTAEIALSLDLLYNVKTNIHLNKLIEVSKIVENLSGFKTHPNKPVVGENVFRRESGLAVTQLIRFPPAVEGYPPELVGGNREIVLGKKSGRRSIEWKIKQMGISAEDYQINDILKQVKLLSEKKRGLVTDDEFSKIVDNVLN